MIRILCSMVVVLGLITAARGDEPVQPPDCVYVPTPYDVVEKMLDMAKVKKTDVVYDLGCGDGRIVIQAAKKRGAKGVGFEIVPKLVNAARRNAKKNQVDHLVTIKQEDLFAADFSEATVLPMYLLPGMIERLMPKLEKLKPGTRIVAHDYPLKDVEPDKMVEVVSNETNVAHVLYLFTAPFKKKGG